MIRLTASEAWDAANIVRAYAEEIRRDMVGAEPSVRALLDSAAKSRDALADKLERIGEGE